MKSNHCQIENDTNKCRVCKNGLDRYGLTRLDMLQIYKDQNRECKICKKSIEMFVGRKGGFIDHNHETGEIRGILCLPCNTTIGYIENKLQFEDLINYLGPLAQLE